MIIFPNRCLVSGQVVVSDATGILERNLTLNASDVVSLARARINEDDGDREVAKFSVKTAP